MLRDAPLGMPSALDMLIRCLTAISVWNVSSFTRKGLWARKKGTGERYVGGRMRDNTSSGFRCRLSSRKSRG